ncbi:phosphate transport system protein [Bowdeniella nasicola]|uniref:Phosphate-specific transport system accessory protein PhoU n=1 Tax=Bowdeniella nasicola TaxID=208480 RepID=A0A1H3ZI17_9ACTO|nr:phosphate signaling complex protein PhoU [Bowdeniella nasicola]SEA23406.1 phosphate transport system protein [Bowdeniella nasicola]
MRAIFRQELEQLGDNLIEMSQLVATAVQKAAKALADSDLALAEQVIDEDEQINELERTVDEMCVSLLARQQPVATDLRVVVTGLMMSTTLERMGDLARHVAYVARGRYPRTAASGDVQKLLNKMGKAATEMAKLVVSLMESRDLSEAARIETDDDHLDQLHREVFTRVLNKDNELDRQELIDIILLARFLERFGDHCVSLARRTSFLVTGDLSNSVSLPLEEDATDPHAG